MLGSSFYLKFHVFTDISFLSVCTCRETPNENHARKKLFYFQKLCNGSYHKVKKQHQKLYSILEITQSY